MFALPVIAAFTLAAAEGDLFGDPDFRAARRAPARRADPTKHQRAADAFATIARRRTDSMEAQIWCARTAYYAAHRLRENKAEMRRIAALGAECGERLLADFEAYPAQLWGLLARFRKVTASSVIPSIGDIERIVRQLEALRAKAPDEYLAYMLLGAVYRELPGWPLSIGDRKKAFERLTEGQRLAPDNSEMLLQLADTYRADGDLKNARLTYKRCAEHGGGPPELAWEMADARAWAKKQLAELE
jgi:hypothetical protein